MNLDGYGCRCWWAWTHGLTIGWNVARNNPGALISLWAPIIMVRNSLPTFSSCFLNVTREWRVYSTLAVFDSFADVKWNFRCTSWTLKFGMLFFRLSLVEFPVHFDDLVRYDVILFVIDFQSFATFFIWLVGLDIHALLVHASYLFLCNFN